MPENLSPIEEDVPFALEHGSTLPEIVSQDTEVELGEMVALLYGEGDLGTRVMVYGGEIYEF
jgi:hypothetical protein